VSDHEDEPEGIEDANSLYTFDKHLIEIPLGESDPAIKPLDFEDNTKEEKANGNSVLEGGLSFGQQGIIRTDRPTDKYGKLTMRERLIILCKLGSGASSAVYKALDITDMRLVALKTIQVYEK
jgi:hypothetical protein